MLLQYENCSQRIVTSVLNKAIRETNSPNYIVAHLYITAKDCGIDAVVLGIHKPTIFGHTSDNYHNIVEVLFVFRMILVPLRRIRNLTSVSEHEFPILQ